MTTLVIYVHFNLIILMINLRYDKEEFFYFIFSLCSFTCEKVENQRIFVNFQCNKSIVLLAKPLFFTCICNRFGFFFTIFFLVFKMNENAIFSFWMIVGILKISHVENHCVEFILITYKKKNLS